MSFGLIAAVSRPWLLLSSNMSVGMLTCLFAAAGTFKGALDPLLFEYGTELAYPRSPATVGGLLTIGGAFQLLIFCFFFIFKFCSPFLCVCTCVYVDFFSHVLVLNMSMLFLFFYFSLLLLASFAAHLLMVVGFAVPSKTLDRVGPMAMALSMLVCGGMVLCARGGMKRTRVDMEGMEKVWLPED